MDDKKQITVISAIGAAALVILVLSVILGGSYYGRVEESAEEQSIDNLKSDIANDTEAETEIITYEEMSTEPLFVSSENTDITEEKNTAQNSAAETESEQVANEVIDSLPTADTDDLSETEETESESEENDDVSVNEEVNENMNAEEKLIALLDDGAPLKWARSQYNYNEFVKVYPDLSFAYYDIESGYEIKYNTDTVKYAASLIKAPYVYAVLCEIEEFEKNKHDFDADGNPLYDENGEPLFEGKHPNYDDDGKIIYLKGEEKYDLSEKWVYDSSTMYVGGSTKIADEDDGFELTWLELINYALLYSDNVAFAQLKERFGDEYFYNKMKEIGITDVNLPEMYLSADDCVKFLLKLYDYLTSGSELSANMKECMINSKHPEMISVNYESCEVAHKYGWDSDAFHDMAIIFDEHPYIIVLMTDYDDGGDEPLGFFKDVTDILKVIHSEKHTAEQ